MLRRPGAVLAAVLATALAADQATKYLALRLLAPSGRSIPVIGQLVRLTFVRNSGAAFGMLPGNRIVFMTVSSLMLAAIAVYWIRVRPARPLIVVALGLVSAGALGNLIDRASTGLVTDFIQIPLDFPVFNVADSAIVIGVAMLVWWILFGPAEHGAATGEHAESADAGGEAAPADHADAAPGARPDGV